MELGGFGLGYNLNRTKLYQLIQAFSIEIALNHLMEMINANKYSLD